MINENLWLVLCHHPHCADAWDVIGIFSTQTAADRACRTPMHVMAPFTINIDLGDEREMRDGWLVPRQGLTRIGGKWVAL